MADSQRLNGKSITEFFPNFDNLGSFTNQNYNYDKGKNMPDLANGKAIFSSTNKDKALKAQNSNVNFKIIKDRDIKNTFNDFSDQFKVH